MEDFANDEHFGKTIAGRYRILEPLGRGGLGVVYKALDTRLSRFVALKVLTLTPTAEFDPSLLQGRTATSLNHPNIVQILDCGMVDGLMYVASVYVEGSDLRQVMARDGALDPQRTIEIIQEVGRGLEYLHQQGLVHRDVNPSNILISTQGSVMLTDFGLTIRSGTATLTETGIAGTPAYMSPEQAMGRPVSAASDVFSLGIILYELLMGCHPFLKSSPEETLRSVVEAVPAMPQKSILAIGVPLTILIKKALHKDPNRRFGNGTEFLAALAIVKKRLVIKQLVESQRDSRLDLADFIGLPAYFEMPRDSSDSKAPMVRAEAALRVRTAERLQPRVPDLEQSSQAPKITRPFWYRKVPLLLGTAFIAFASLTVWNTSPWQFWAGLAGTAGIATWYLVWKFRDSRDDRKPLTLSLSVAAANPSALPKSKPVARTPSQGSTGQLPVTLLNIQPYKSQSDAKATRYLNRSTLASLFVFDSSGRSEAFRLGNQFTIGRVKGCDLVIESQAVSRTHAQIFFEVERFYIKDLNSSLGTFVNGSRIEMCELHHEDEITIGDKTMLFVQDVSPRLNSDARRRRKEFETVWEQLTSSARDE